MSRNNTSQSRRKFLKRTALAGGITTFGALSASPVDAAQVLHVNPNNPDAFDTIQQAVNQAQSGDQILVAEATYKESVSIDVSDITITGDPGDSEPGVGPNAPLLDGEEESKDGFEMLSGASGVTIEGFEIRDFGLDEEQRGYGIRAIQPASEDITIRDNFIYDCGWSSIATWSNGDYRHSRWSVDRNKLGGSSFAEIALANTIESEIRNNLILDVTAVPDAGNDYSQNGRFNHYGIIVSARSRTGSDITTHSILIEDNTIRDVTGGDGINIGSLDGSGPPEVQEDTTVTLRDVTVRNNTITGVDGARIGILFNSRPAGKGTNSIESVEITDNLVSGFIAGMYLDDPEDHGLTDVSITSNRIEENDYGAVVTEGSPVGGISLSMNDLVDCSEYAIWNLGEGVISATCNYWGHATGPDDADNRKGKGESTNGEIDYAPWLPQSHEKVSANSCHGGQNNGKGNS